MSSSSYALKFVSPVTESGTSWSALSSNTCALVLLWCLDPSSGCCKVPGTCLDRLPVRTRAAHQGPLRVSGGSECDLSPRGDATPELGPHLGKPSASHSHREVWPKLLVTTGRRHSTKGNVRGVLIIITVIVTVGYSSSSSRPFLITDTVMSKLHPFSRLFWSLLISKLSLSLWYHSSSLTSIFPKETEAPVYCIGWKYYTLNPELEYSMPGIPNCYFTILEIGS